MRRGCFCLLLLLLVATAAPARADGTPPDVNFSLTVADTGPDPLFLSFVLSQTTGMTTNTLATLFFTVAPDGTIVVNTGGLSLTSGSDISFTLSGAASTSLGTNPVVAFVSGASIPDSPPPNDRIFFPSTYFLGGSVIQYEAPENVGTWSLTATTTPEPGTVGLTLIGLGLLMLMARKP